MIDSSKSILKSFRGFLFGTALSRVFGLLRDLLTAFFFGASPYIASFMVAYRLSNLFRRLLGESSLNASFIPHYEHLRVEDKKKSSRFYRDVFASIMVVITFIVIVVEIILFLISNYVVNKEVLYLTQIMLPGLLFICLYAVNSAVLQCHKKHFLAAIAPLFFNLVWVFAVLNFNKLGDKVFVYVLSVFVVFAFLLQYLTTFNSSYEILKENLDSNEILKPTLFSRDIRNILKPILYSIIGIGAVQINSALDSVFALFINKSAPAYLWYSMRLYQVPIAFFGIAIASALLPPLTRAFKLDDIENFKSFFNLAFKKCFSLMFFSTVAILILAPSMINLIYGRGEFKVDSIINTMYSLYGYGSGLIFASFIMIISAAFYAKKQYFPPMFSSIMTVVINMVLNYIFVFVFKFHVSSIAFSTSISAFFNFLFLYYFLNKNIKNIFEKGILLTFVKIAFSSVFSACITVVLGVYINEPSILFLLRRSNILPNNFLIQLYSFISMLSIYIVGYLFIGILFRINEFSFFKSKANE